MISEQEAVRNAIAAFTTLHTEAQYRAGVRGLDRGELNLHDMKCVARTALGYALSLIFTCRY
ncbi:MAG: hypothetical protein ABSA92_16705 [Candidatus Bathyarchaeia archaeon]